ncbi:MAG: divergent polysaccharide deacetylase family protein [Paracoccaceae bacterium]
MISRAFIRGILAGGAVSAVSAVVMSLSAEQPKGPDVVAQAPTQGAPDGADVGSEAGRPKTQTSTLTRSGSAPALAEAAADAAGSQPVEVDAAAAPAPDMATAQTQAPSPERMARDAETLDLPAQPLDPVIPALPPALSERPEIDQVADLLDSGAGPAPGQPVEIEAVTARLGSPNVDSAAPKIPGPDSDIAIAAQVFDAPQLQITAARPSDFVTQSPARPDASPVISAPQTVDTAPFQPVDVPRTRVDRTVRQTPNATAADLAAPPKANAPDPQVAQAAITPVRRPPVNRPSFAAQQPEFQSTQSTRPVIGRPATSILDRNAKTAADTASAAADRDANTPTQAAQNTGLTPSGKVPALKAYAEPFENPDERPLMSIVLMDIGLSLTDGPIGLAALGSFPYPITFAVDAESPDAADRAALYRAQGFEVMAKVDLPENLTAADTEVALGAAFDAIPEAVAVMEGTKAGLQGSREITQQVAKILTDTGHGIVWQPKGLDTAQKFAARDGVASVTVFRDFDAKGQTPVVIRRFLDQAAFRARQLGGVVMVGRVRPETISALLLWGLQDRVNQVAVAPVSAALSQGKQ